MAYIITEPCIGCKDKACTTVCPVDCIHEGVVEKDGRVYDQLFIDPDECICCNACETECPVDAIFEEDEVPEPWKHFIEINARFYHPSHGNPSHGEG